MNEYGFEAGRRSLPIAVHELVIHERVAEFILHGGGERRAGSPWHAGKAEKMRQSNVLRLCVPVEP